MLPPVRVRAAGDEPVPVVDSVHAAIRRAPLLVRPALTVLAVIFLPWLLAPICVFCRARTVLASLYVAAFYSWVYLLISANRMDVHAEPTATAGPQAHTIPGGWLLALLVTPFLVGALASARPLSRWFVSCRTTAWSLLWSLPVVFVIVQASPQNSMFAVIAVWVIAAALIGWRAAKGSQEARMFGPDGPFAQQPGANPAAPGNPGPQTPPGAPSARPGRGGRAGAESGPSHRPAGPRRRPRPG